MRKIILLLLMIGLSQCLAVDLFGQDAPICSDSTSFSRIREKWNKELSKFSDGTWQIPDYKQFSTVKDSLKITHVLYGPDIDCRIVVNRAGCIKNMVLGMSLNRSTAQSAVAVTKLIKVFNPEVDSQKRNADIVEMLTGAHESFRVSYGSNIYYYWIDRGAQRSSLRVTTKN